MKKKYFVEVTSTGSNYKGLEWFTSKEDAIGFAEEFKNKGWIVDIFEAHCISD